MHIVVFNTQRSRPDHQTSTLHEPLENISEEPTPTISLRFASKQVFLTALQSGQPNEMNCWPNVGKLHSRSILVSHVHTCYCKYLVSLSLSLSLWYGYSTFHCIMLHHITLDHHMHGIIFDWNLLKYKNCKGESKNTWTLNMFSVISMITWLVWPCDACDGTSRGLQR